MAQAKRATEGRKRIPWENLQTAYNLINLPRSTSNSSDGSTNINQDLLDEDIWIPIKLNSNIKEEISEGNKNFRQIKDNVDFVKDLINILYGKETHNY